MIAFFTTTLTTWIEIGENDFDFKLNALTDLRSNN